MTKKSGPRVVYSFVGSSHFNPMTEFGFGDSKTFSLEALTSKRFVIGEFVQVMLLSCTWETWGCWQLHT